MKLVIGNKNYSSWSLRPWLLLTVHKLDFTEILESLTQDRINERLLQYSSSAKVPVLIDQDTVVWDSLAICEYINDNYLAGRGWPSNQNDKAIARSITAEMHAGFNALRSEMPMNCRNIRIIELSDAAKSDISRIDDIFSSYAREASSNIIRLFGEFTIADCFYAPIALRCLSYGIRLSPKAQAYVDSLLEHPAILTWVTQAKLEAEVVPENETGL